MEIKSLFSPLKMKTMEIFKNQESILSLRAPSDVFAFCSKMKFQSDPPGMAGSQSWAESHTNTKSPTLFPQRTQKQNLDSIFMEVYCQNTGTHMQTGHLRMQTHTRSL